MATKITTRVLADDAVTDAKIADVTLTTATQSASDNTTKIATTAYVTTAIANLADSAPSTLNTLNELAAALGDDANYATTTTNAIATKLPLAGGTLSGAVILGTSAAQGNQTSPALRFGPSTYRLGMYTDSEGAFIENKNGDDGINFLVKTAGQAMRIDGGTGNVGIGTVDPSDPLVVQSSGSIGGGSTNANSYFTITDGTYNLLHDPNEIFSDINGTFHIGANHSNGALRFHTGGTASRMDILSDGKVGIGISPSAQLHVKGVGVLFDSDSYNILEVRTDANDDGSSDDGIIKITNSSSSTTKGELRWDESENKVHLAYGDHGRSLVIDSSHNVGVGTSNNSLDSRFNVRADNNSAGDLYTQIGPGNAPGITIQNGGTTDSNHATIFFKNDSGHRAHIGAKFVNHSTEETNLTFGTTDSSGNARERLHLVTNYRGGADFIGREGPNATSSTAGDNWQLVADRAMEVIQDDGNASNWITMKTFTLGANCTSLSIKWAAKNSSGTYYWAWRITRNGTVMSMVNHGGGNAQKSFSYGLASGESSSVHAFRSYDVDVGEAYAGDVIKLEMINATGGGTPVAGTQYLYCKQFLVTSLDKGKMYNGDRGTIRRPMIYGATQHVQYNGNEYDLGSFEFPFRMDSGTHNVVELAEFETGTVANATMQYVGLYGYAGRNMGQGMAMASTRRRSNNTDWEDIDGATVHSANGSNGGITHPDFYWADGVLKVGVSASLQITGRIRVTWRQATIQRHWNI